MTTPADSNLVFVFEATPSGSTTDASADTASKTTRRKKMPTSGYCEAGNHHLCPHLLRAHRFTPKGTELRELTCPCPCHTKP